jgi:hypothetical protein
MPSESFELELLLLIGPQDDLEVRRADGDLQR